MDEPIMNNKILAISLCAIGFMSIMGFMTIRLLYPPPIKDVAPHNGLTQGYMVIGNSKIELKPGDTIGVQVDRVVRDVAWVNSTFGANRLPDHVPVNSSDVVPYMEGARVRDMMNWASVQVMPLTPARAQPRLSKSSGQTLYYAADGRGNYNFLVDPSKINSAVKPSNNENDVVILPDTHGFNMIAEQAYLNRDKLHLAVACMDLPSKADAALYLAQNGINIYAPCDRFASELMDYKRKYGVNTTIIGSAPIRKTTDGAIIGAQPIRIELNETIVVQFTDKGYPDQYSDTPWRYFTALSEAYGFNLNLVKANANAGEARLVVNLAIQSHAKVIGVRVYNYQDYEAVATWLKQDTTRRAVLLHSVAYDGVYLFRDFPEQTTFGDLNPQIFKLNKLP
jgi:hypothetical protein